MNVLWLRRLRRPFPPARRRWDHGPKGKGSHGEGERCRCRYEHTQDTGAESKSCCRERFPVHGETVARSQRNVLPADVPAEHRTPAIPHVATAPPGRPAPRHPGQPPHMEPEPTPATPTGPPPLARNGRLSRPRASARNSAICHGCPLPSVRGVSRGIASPRSQRR